MIHIEIAITDSHWPKLKMTVNRDGRVRTVEAPYDIAGSQFEPAVKDSLRLATEEIIKTHKGG